MSQLSKAQVTILYDMLQNDEKFRTMVQNHLERKMSVVEKEVNTLRNAAKEFGGNMTKQRKRSAKSNSSAVPKPFVLEKAARKPRKRNANTKTAAVLNAIGSHKQGISASALDVSLQSQNIEIKRTMLNSYLFQLKRRGDITVTGSRGSYLYKITE